MPGLDQTAVRRVNTAVVLRALADSTDDMTLLSLVEQTGLSRRTVELIVGDLLADGWVREAPAESAGGAGRPARRFAFAADRRLIAGARIDTHLAHAVVADLRGRVLGRAERVLGDDYGVPERAVRHAADAIREAAAEAGVSLDRLAAGGIAAGGMIDPDTGVVDRLVDAPRWSGFPLADALAETFGIPWLADNDANLAALAELRDGAAHGHRHIAWLIHGQRTGAGFIVGGELHRGAGGAAGELIESRVLGLPLDSKDVIRTLSSPLPEERDAAATAVRAALAGDPVALAAAQSLADDIANIIDVIAWTIAPELIVLGGGLEHGAELLIPLVRDRLDRLGAPPVELAPSEIGAEGPILGAVRFALERVEPELYGPAIG